MKPPSLSYAVTITFLFATFLFFVLVPTGVFISFLLLLFLTAPGSLLYIRQLECQQISSLNYAATLLNASARPQTRTTIPWNVPPWLANESSTPEQTPDISSLLRQVITNPFWAAKNAFTLFITGNTTQFTNRVAWAQLNPATPTGATPPGAMPTLYIEYADSIDNLNSNDERACVFPFKWNNITYYSCTSIPTPEIGSIVGSWCGTAAVVLQAEWGYCASHYVTTTGHGSFPDDGNQGNQTQGGGGGGVTNPPCAFPFVFNGELFYDCISTPGFARTESPWCATTPNYDTDMQWGYCSILTYGGSGGGLACQFPFWFNGVKYDACTTDGGRGVDTPWCATDNTEPSTLAPQFWGYCSEGIQTERSYGYDCACPPGVAGLACDVPCRAGTWGSSCQNTCSCILEQSSCDPVTGTCVCNPGFTGAVCDQVCTGTQCPTFDCTLCALGTNATCSVANPVCSCPNGTAPPYCLEACPLGTYGENCMGNCSSACAGICRVTDGLCVCPTGYGGANCSTPCINGTFGSNCNLYCQCNIRYKGLPTFSTCAATSGVCTCGPGWSGPSCQVPTTNIYNVPFINEIHYQNNANDTTQDVIELAGSAGINLQGYSLYLYDGGNGAPCVLGSGGSTFTCTSVGILSVTS